jgi:hypothetical protein
MRKLKRIRDRLGYHDNHFSQLASGHDWFGGWGHLERMDDATLAATVQEMADCWRAHEADVRALCEPRTPWFQDYAADPQNLITEVIATREYTKNFPHGSECCCASCTP